MRAVSLALWLGILFLFSSSVVSAQGEAPGNLYRIVREEGPKKDPNVLLRQETALRSSNTCNCISNVEGDLLLCDNFQTYNEGPITPQSSLWSLWPGATRDGFVDASGSNKYLRLKHEDGAESDVLLDLGNQTEGVYHLSFRLWTWEGFSGYYNIQHNSSFTNNQNANWAYHLQFINGEGNLRLGSFSRPLATRNFTYNQNAWNYITQIIDLDNDEITLEINGTTIARWQFSLGSRSLEKRIGALNFYANEEFNAQFVVDNICMVRTDVDTPPPADVNLSCADRGEIEINDLQLSLSNIQVQNTGSTPSAPTRFGYYLSTNTNFTTKDYLIASAEIPALAPGEIATFSLNMDLRDADVPDDFYYLGYVIDYPDLVEETNEDDNNDCYWNNIRFQYITIVRRANLVCHDRGSLNIQDQLLEINQLEITNTGNKEAPASVLGVYLSANTNITNSDLLIGTIATPSIQDGEKISVDFQIRLDTLNQIASGDYYLGFFIDYLNAVKEFDDDDNICAWTESTIPINPVPSFINLSCSDLGNITLENQMINIQGFALANTGNQASGDFSVAFYLSENENITTSDFLIDEQAVSSIAPETSILIDNSIDLSMLNLPPGDYYLGLIVDSQSEVEESDKSDNATCVWTEQQVQILAPVPAECSCVDPTLDYLCDDFERYAQGFLSNQSDCFTTGSGNSNGDDDGVITQVVAFSGNQSLGIRENRVADVHLRLGDKEAGTYILEWMMYIPTGKSARYALEGQALFGVTNKLEMTFGNVAGSRGFLVQNTSIFNYPEEEWFKVMPEYMFKILE